MNALCVCHSVTNRNEVLLWIPCTCAGLDAVFSFFHYLLFIIVTLGRLYISWNFKAYNLKKSEWMLKKNV